MLVLRLRYCKILIENAIIHKPIKQSYLPKQLKKGNIVVLLIIQTDISIKEELDKETYLSVNFFDMAKAKERNFEVIDLRHDDISVDDNDINIDNEISKCENYTKRNEVKDAYIIKNSDKPLNDYNYDCHFIRN